MVAAAVAVALVLVLGGGSSAPPDALARLAPPDTLLWVDAADDAGARRAWSLAMRFPALRAEPQALAARLGLRGFDAARDLRPWLGDELAVALVPEGAATAPLVLAAVADVGAARRTLEGLGARPAGRAGAAALFATSAPRTLVALAGRRLVAGPAAAVRAALARAHGLDGVATYRRAVAEREDGAVTAYASADGVGRLLGASDPLVRAGATLLAAPALQAVAAELAPQDGGLSLHAHVLRGAGAPATVAPTLLGRVPDGAAAMLLLPGGRQLAALTERLGGAAVLAALRAALAQESGLDLDRDVLAPLREAVLALQAHGDVPVVTLAARTTDEAGTRGALARLQSPLAARLTGGVDQSFQTTRGDAFTLPVTPELQPSYAVDGDVLVASTAQAGLAERRLAARGIARAGALARVLSSHEGSVQALGFLDLRQLLALGERTGLGSASGFQAVRSDLGPIRTAGAVLEPDPDHPTDTTAELFLEIP